MKTENKNNLKGLVTGATGFLGRHICQQLLQQGWQVYALCRSLEKSKTLNQDINIVIGDLLSPQDFTDKIPANLDALFHTAASTNTWYKNNAMQTKTNLQGTQNMLDFAVANNTTKFIHISSVVVFGIHTHLRNITEDMPKEGANSFINYVKTKTASEKKVLDCKELETVIVNPTHIIGPGDKSNWARLIKMIAENKLPSIPNGSGSFADVRDVAAGIIAAYHNGNKAENYLLGGTDMSFKQFVHAVAKSLRVNPTGIQLPNYLLNALAHIKNTVSTITKKEPDITPESVALISDLYACDSAKARTQFHYKTRDFSITLKDTLDFLKKENLIN